MFNDIDLDFNMNDGSITQEAYAGPTGYSDLFNEKFATFDPTAIVSGGNGKLKSGMFDMDIEDSDLALGYKNAAPAVSPKPGRFM